MNWKLVKSEDIKSVVNNVEWQELRNSFIGTWKHKPVENVKFLREYLSDMSDPYKVRRVLNYLTGSAFRIKLIKHKDIDKLLSEIRNIWRSKTQ